MKKNTTKQKIDTYVSVKDIERLEIIVVKYGFKSRYQLLQYLIHCFLRVADPAHDPIEEPIPSEITDMFTDNAEWEIRVQTYASHEGMYLKQAPDQRVIKTPDDLK